MTNLKRLQHLVDASTAASELAQQSYRELAQKEQRIRMELEKLRQALLTSRAPSQAAMPLRGIGADVAWQSAIGRNQRRLNIELARVLAQKEPYLARARVAFGKSQVAMKLLKDARTEQNAKQSTKHTEQIWESTL